MKYNHIPSSAKEMIISSIGKLADGFSKAKEHLIKKTRPVPGASSPEREEIFRMAHEKGISYEEAFDLIYGTNISHKSTQTKGGSK